MFQYRKRYVRVATTVVKFGAETGAKLFQYRKRYVRVATEKALKLWYELTKFQYRKRYVRVATYGRICICDSW